MRLIDADALMKTLGITDMECDKCKWGSHGRCTRGADFEDACCAIEDAPTVEKHGHWVSKIIDERFDFPHTVARCSECGGKIWFHAKRSIVDLPYCPGCGAKMDGERREDETD